MECNNDLTKGVLKLRFIKLDENNKIISIRYGQEIVQGEIQSNTGELGQIMQPDGSFITPEPDPIEPEPTIEEQILFETQYQTAVLEILSLGGM